MRTRITLSVRRATLALASVLALSAAACNQDKPKAAAPAGPPAAAPAAPRVDTARARELIADGALVVDVREQTEWDGGHLPQARHIPAGAVGQRLAEIEQAAGGKDKPIVLHCAAGGRAAKAKAELEAAGFTNVTNGGGYRALAEAPAPPPPAPPAP